MAALTQLRGWQLSDLDCGTSRSLNSQALGFRLEKTLHKFKAHPLSSRTFTCLPFPLLFPVLADLNVDRSWARAQSLPFPVAVTAYYISSIPGTIVPQIYINSMQKCSFGQNNHL